MKVLVVQQRYGIGDMVIFSPYIQAISNNLKTSVTLLAKKVLELEIYLLMTNLWMKLLI